MTPNQRRDAARAAVADVPPGIRAMAQRAVNAESNFLDSAMDRGLTRDEAACALATYRRERIVKLDAVNGVYSVARGVFWEPDVLRRAAAVCGRKT